MNNIVIHNKIGYKRTKLGWIPEDWEISTISQVCNVKGRIGYRGYTVKDIVEKGKGAITLSPSNIRNNQLVSNNDTYISWFKYEESPEIQLDVNDIVLVKTGSTYGKVAIVKKLEEKTTVNPQIVVIKDISGDELFLSYLMSFNIVQKQIEATVVGGAIPTLTQESILNFKIPLPPLHEQQKIAKILSTWDESIDKQKQLILQKESLKKGLMQQLLTGKKRFAGFAEEWETKKLHELTIEKGIVRGPFGGALKKEIFVNDGFKVYEQKNAIYSNVELGRYYVDEEKYNEMKRFSIQQNDLIISCSGTIGKIYKIPKHFPKGIINQALLKLTLNLNIVDVDFFQFQFNSPRIQFTIIESTQGGAMKNLVGIREFRATKFRMPDIKEQKKIADVLSAADNEIENLQQKLDILKEQKKGLMQKLLTGEVRVKV